MAVIVQKYGGSSVADVAKIAHVADRVVAAKRAGHDVVVVVSAMGKTTDELIGLARRAAETAGSDSPPSGIAGRVRGGTPEPPRRELDMLVSTGERVSMALLSIAIHARGEDAISFTGSQSGILTNDRHFDARIIEVRPHRIQDELARGRVVIVAGYQGMSYRREITTLGRGGSDTTAVALAAALSADRCEIYSDVDGVYTGDPRVVDGPKHIPVLDLDVLAEMAEAGAKVLNAQAVEWARRNKIAIHARKTSDPVGGGKETIAREEEIARVADEGRHVRAVVGHGNVVLASLPRRALSALVTAAGELDIALGDVVAQGDRATAHLPLLNVPDWQRCTHVLEQGLGSDLTLAPNHAVVSVVGYGLTASRGTLPKMMTVLDEAGVEPACFSAGPLRISATVRSEVLSDLERRLHAAFVG